MAETVVIDFSVDTTELNKAVDAMEALGKITKDDADKFRKANQDFKQSGEGIKATSENAKAAANNISKLGDEAKKAGEGVSKSANIAERSMGGLSTTLKTIGGTIVAAFAVHAVLDFAKASVEVAKAVEQNEARLLIALGGREALQQRLISQAKELEATTGVDDIAIVKQQVFLAQQGRTATEIDKTIKAAIRLSKITGEDLSTAVEKMDATFEGNIGRLGKLDDNFTKLTESQLRNGAAVDLINEKYNEILTLQTDSEQAANAYGSAIENIQEKFGKLLLRATPVIDFLAAVIDSLDRLASSDRDIEINISTKETNGAVENALKDYEASRSAYERIGKSAEEAITLALKDEVDARNALILKLDKTTQARQILIFSAQKQALKDNAQAELDALTSGVDARKKQAEKEAAEAAKNRAKALSDLEKAAQEESRLRKEIFDHQQQLNRESAAESSKLQVLALKAQQEKEIQAVNQSYVAKADFSKASEINLQKELLRIRIKYLEQEALLFEDDKVKQSEINNQVLAIKTQLYEKDVDLAKAAEDEKTRIADEAAKKRAKLQQDIFDGLQAGSTLFTQLADNFAAATERQIESIQEQLDAQLNAYDKDSQANQDAFNKKTISEIEFRRKENELLKKKEQAEAEAARKQAELRRKEYNAKKLAAVFEIIINTASAVAEALPNIPLSILVAGLGGVQLGTAASQPVPKFSKGTLSVKGAGTSDTVHAMLTPGESVMTRQNTFDYMPTLTAIHNRKITPKDLNDLVNWKMNGGNTSHSSSTPIDYDKLASAIVWQSNQYGKKGVKILNVEDFAPLFGGGTYRRGLS